MAKVLAEVFGANVRSLREKNGLSQEVLGKRAKLQRSYISDVERGTRNISLSSICKLAKALRVNPSELVSNLPSRGI